MVRTGAARVKVELGGLAALCVVPWRARAFQRASSAVEGRNGYSQMQHNHRGLPTRRYQVWTVLHNFDCRASDGTTPAVRFFRREFPDLFESVLTQIDALCPDNAIRLSP